MRRDARRHTAGGVVGVDRDGVGGPVRVGVVVDHLRQGEGEGEGRPQRRADDAARVADHEGHLGGGDVFGRDDQVALVLAVGRVEHDDELAAAEGGDGGGDGVEF